MLTEETVAEKLALVAPAATVTEAGTVTEALLLVRFTANPPLAAAAFSVTVQVSVPDPLIEDSVQDSELSAGVPDPEPEPEPGIVTLTTVDGALETLAESTVSTK